MVSRKTGSVVLKEYLQGTSFSGPQTAVSQRLSTMAVLWLVLLVGLSTLNLGVFTWAAIHHFLTAEIPSVLKHPVKLRFLHCVVLYVIALVSLLLGALCSSEFISVGFSSFILL